MRLTAMKPQILANLIVGFSLLIVAVNGVILRGHELDDSLIYARYLQNLITGNGLVYNPGEYVNGLTSPLFAWLSIVPAVVSGDARVGIMWVSVLAALGTVYVTYRILVSIVADPRIAALVTLLSASSGITYINLGMETSLFTFIVGLCIVLYFKDKFDLLGIGLALAILTRPEAVFLVPAMALNSWIYNRRWPDYRCFIAPTLVVSLQLLFNAIYFGSILPTSGVAKIAQGSSGDWGQNVFLENLFLAFLYGFGEPGQLLFLGYYWIPILLVVLSIFAVFLPQARQYLMVSFLFLFTYTSFFVTFNIPSQWWYYAIYFTIFSTWIVLGIFWIYIQFFSSIRTSFLIICVGFFSALLAWQEPKILALHGSTLREDYKQFGLWIAENTDAEASVALAEIGTVGWYSKRRIIDMLGLVSEYNADFVADGDYESWLQWHIPDYILASQPPRIYEFAVTSLLENHPERLTEVGDFQFPGYKLYRYIPNVGE